MTLIEDRFRPSLDGPLAMPATGGRVLPHDLDAEGAVLSAVLLSTDAFDLVQEFVRPEHFYSDANRRIFEAVMDLQGSGKPVDMVSVASWLKDRLLLPAVGGMAYIVQLTNAIPAVANAEHHARTVREKWRLRQLIQACQRFAAEGYGECSDAQAFVDRAEQAIFEIARIPEASTIVPLKSAVVDAFRIIAEAAKRGGSGAVTGIPTGFDKLDKMTSGMHDGELYIVAGRPGMGKTSFVLNMAANVAKPRMVSHAPGEDPLVEGTVEEPGYGVAFFSLEMPREQLASRLLASEARVDVSRIRSGDIRREDWNKLTEAAARLGRMPIWIDDMPAISLLDIRAKVRRLQADLQRGGPDQAPATKLGLVVIDYLQLMSGRRDAGSREQEISELSRGLKHLAKEMRVPVLALSQLNRSVETRNTKDKRPVLSDLRESGAIEQDADVILFIYRDEYYFKAESLDKGIAEVIIAKQRNGPTGTVKTKFTGEYTRFDNLAYDEYNEFDDFDPELTASGAAGAS